MTAEIIRLADRKRMAGGPPLGKVSPGSDGNTRNRLALDAEHPAWLSSERGHAAWLMVRAISHLERDKIGLASILARMAHQIIDRLEREGITLAHKRLDLERRRRRMASTEKAAETRACNRLAAAQSAHTPLR
jgi:hypothetical protein